MTDTVTRMASGVESTMPRVRLSGLTGWMERDWDHPGMVWAMGWPRLSMGGEKVLPDRARTLS